MSLDLNHGCILFHSHSFFKFRLLLIYCWAKGGLRGAQDSPIIWIIKRSVFLTNTQSSFDKIDIVLRPLRLVCHTWRCPYFSVVPEATDEARLRGPLKGTASAKKTLQVYEIKMRELLGGMGDKSLKSNLAPLIFDCLRLRWLSSSPEIASLKLVV